MRYMMIARCDGVSTDIPMISTVASLLLTARKMDSHGLCQVINHCEPQMKSYLTLTQMVTSVKFKLK
nr:MAG TPA: hypothetical protein [Caudoviricetes sp.]